MEADMTFNLELVVIIGMSYLFVFGLFCVFAGQLNAERKKNDALIDAVIAKNLPEKTRKRIIDSRLKRMEKQAELPFISKPAESPKPINMGGMEEPLQEGDIE
jgi:hypothetical protein